jgi:hypothetical protein
MVFDTTAIRPLLNGGSPAHVARLVVAIGVDAIERVQRPAARVPALRPRPDLSFDVGDECRQVMPALADGDAPSSVPREGNRVLVVATAHHLLVRLAQRMRIKSVRAGSLPLPASARLRLHFHESRQRKGSRIPAVAQAGGGTPSRRLGRLDTYPGIGALYHELSESLSDFYEHFGLSSAHRSNCTLAAVSN